jgi:hypothetical protein
MVEHRITVLETEMEHVQHDVGELLREVKQLNESLARYRGAWGAITMIFAAIATAGGLALKFWKS